MAYSFDDSDLSSKRKRMIESLDQMSQMAQDKIGARPESPVVGQESQPPLSKIAGQIEPFKGQEAPNSPQAAPTPPVQPIQEQVPQATQAPEKKSAGDIIKSILTYALPMALTASKGMGVLPGAVAGLSAQNKADVVSNQQAIERVKEANAAKYNEERAKEQLIRDQLLGESKKTENEIRRLTAGTEAQKVNQSGQVIPSEIALKEAQAAKDARLTPIERIMDALGIGKGGSRKSTNSASTSDIHAPLPGETYAQYKKRVSK